MTAQEKYLAIVRDIVLRHVDCGRYAVFLFGSRAAGNNGRFADIDVGIEGKHPLDAKIRSAILDDIEESLAPFHVDIVDFYGADEQFAKIAKQRVIPWNQPNNLH